MKPIFRGSAMAAVVLLPSFLFFAAKPSVAETALAESQKTVQQPSKSFNKEASAPSDSLSKTVPEMSRGKVVEPAQAAETLVSLPMSYVATAYSLRGRTASGRFVSQGVIAADPRVLPLGSRVRVEAGAWSRDYLVADTGGAICARKIDIWTPSTREAMRFGRRTVKLTVLSYGRKRAASKRRVHG